MHYASPGDWYWFWQSLQRNQIWFHHILWWFPNSVSNSFYSPFFYHRFKIVLALTKKILGATDDTNIIEIARVNGGVIKSHARNSQYAVLEATLARRTFDESGDYTVNEPDFDVRESVISGNNRGVYTDGAKTSDGGTAITSMLAVGVSPFKAYVRGFEAERIGTTWLDVDMARDFDTQNYLKTRFDIRNFVYVDNVYGTPDVNFVSGDSEAFKTINYTTQQQLFVVLNNLHLVILLHKLEERNHVDLN